MTMALCERHGRNGIRVLCPHLAEDMRTGSLGPTRSTLWFLMCPACLDSHPAHQVLEGIRVEDLIERRDLDDAMDDSAANLPEHVAACGMCVDEALLAGTRARRA